MNSLFPKVMGITKKQLASLVKYDKLTLSDLPNIKIGEDFYDLVRLGLIGPYIEEPSTSECPRLFYHYNKKSECWDTYAIEHDLIGFNLGSIAGLSNRVDTNEEKIVKLREDVDELQEVVLPPTPPTPPQPPTPPTPCEFIYSKIDRDDKLTGGKDLQKIIDGGILILGGKIKKYEESRIFPATGNYVGCKITPDCSTWHYFANNPQVIYKGMCYGSEVFSPDGTLTLLIQVKVPGQETPIDIKWNEELTEHFIIAITQESEFE